ncbi:Wzz/FepE/Etk N-terminal domain-containing protein [Mycoplasmatota bacterium WC44]
MDNNQREEYLEIDLISLFKTLLRKWYVILVVVSITGGLGSLYIFNMEDEYTSSASMIVEVSNENQSDYTDILMGQKLVSTYKEVLKSDRVLGRVIHELDLDYSVEELRNLLNITSVGDTVILKISTTTTSKVKSFNIVTKTTDILIELSKEFDSLDNIEILDTAKVAVIPDSNNSMMYLIISIMLGGMLSVLIIFIIEFTNTKVRTETDVENILGLSILGVIPEYDIKSLKQS